MSKIKDWAVDSGVAIVKDFSFNSFKEAMDFVNNVAEIAETQNHHPDIIISFRNVRISSTTHEENGLTSKDFDLAEEIDKIGKEEVKTETAEENNEKKDGEAAEE